MPDPVCELCGDDVPARLVRSAPQRGWDCLCPACWMLNVPDAGAWECWTPETEGRLWTPAEAQRFHNHAWSAFLDMHVTLAARSPYAVRVYPEA